ncbi:MAG: hypothetical protein ACP5H7_02510 [Minisyncoccia bacterium]
MSEQNQENKNTDGKIQRESKEIQKEEDSIKNQMINILILIFFIIIFWIISSKVYK